MKVKVYEWLRRTGSGLNVPFSNPIRFNEYISFKLRYEDGVDGRDNVWLGNGSWNEKDRSQYGVISVNKVNRYKLGAQYTREYQTDSIVTEIKQGVGYVEINGTRYAQENQDMALWIILYRNNQVVSDIKSDTFHLVPCLTETNEACMIDLLSGELYRNQGSGAFSVEGECLYEFETPSINRIMRKPNIVVRLRKWIKRSDDYTENIIQTNIPLSKTIPTTITAPIQYYPQWNLVRFSDTFRRLQITERGWIYTEQTGESRFIGKDNVIKVFSDRLECAGNVYTLPIEETNISIIFAYNSGSPQWLGEIKQDGVINLRPCDILYHPTLPPQSAMIDTNTGTIYTNQGSGQFTCEGEDLGIWTDTLYDDMRIKDVKADMVCVMHNGEPRVVYERTQPFIEHKWLKGDGLAFINTLAHFNECETDLKTSFIIHEMPSASGVYKALFGARNYSANSNINASTPAIINYSRGVSFRWTRNFDKYTPHLEEGVVYDVCVDNSKGVWTLNEYEEQITKENTGIIIRNDFYIFTEGDTQNMPQTNRVIKADFGEFVFGDYHLTPCHLIRPLSLSEIASSNTALRGECGFADKEKYKRGEPWFYGNKATSGSFSVSDE